MINSSFKTHTTVHSFHIVLKIFILILENFEERKKKLMKEKIKNKIKYKLKVNKLFLYIFINQFFFFFN